VTDYFTDHFRSTGHSIDFAVRLSLFPTLMSIRLIELIMSRAFFQHQGFFLSVGTEGPTIPTPSGEESSTTREQSTGATSPRNSGESQHVG
jgi:hypothetical protein